MSEIPFDRILKELPFDLIPEIFSFMSVPQKFPTLIFRREISGVLKRIRDAALFPSKAEAAEFLFHVKTIRWEQGSSPVYGENAIETLPEWEGLTLEGFLLARDPTAEIPGEIQAILAEIRAVAKQQFGFAKYIKRWLRDESSGFHRWDGDAVVVPLVASARLVLRLDLTGKHMAYLYNLPLILNLVNLKLLDVSYTSVTDLSQLPVFQKLESLRLEKVPAADFSPVSSLKNLRKLNLSATSFSDAGILRDLVSLQKL